MNLDAPQFNMGSTMISAPVVCPERTDEVLCGFGHDAVMLSALGGSGEVSE
jgi:hypothetical protein